MADTVDALVRSRNMARIRSRDTAPELAVRRALHAAGFRFRLHRSDLPGRPDIVLPRYRTVVFVHGCFWHGHSCIDGHIPKSREDYWGPKIQRNVTRGRHALLQLRKNGWRVYVIWECKIETGVRRLLTQLEKKLPARNP